MHIQQCQLNIFKQRVKQFIKPKRWTGNTVGVTIIVPPSFYSHNYHQPHTGIWANMAINVKTTRQRKMMRNILSRTMETNLHSVLALSSISLYSLEAEIIFVTWSNLVWILSRTLVVWMALLYDSIEGVWFWEVGSLGSSSSISLGERSPCPGVLPWSLPLHEKACIMLPLQWDESWWLCWKQKWEDMIRSDTFISCHIF